jgi:predicted alpha-1,2-mannosidase
MVKSSTAFMIKNSVLFSIIILVILLSSCDKESNINKKEECDYTSYVNPLMGTNSEFLLSNGNTYPAVARPWGMNFWTPMTANFGDGWTYKYQDHKITGFKQTHQPSPWINDYAAFSFMAVTSNLKIKESERASWFSHKAEEVKPHYYSVYLADYDTKVELTATERAAYFQFTFPESDSSYILLDGFPQGSMVKIIPNERKIIGYCKNNHGGVPENFCNYFVAVFDKEFEITHTWTDSTLQENSLYSEADHVGAVVGFKTKRGEKVHVKVASSFISPTQAEFNLASEIGDRSFDMIKQDGHTIWNKELGRIIVEGKNIDNIRTFYSTLYRVLLFPRKFYEINEKGQIVHYSPYNGKVQEGYMFTDNGFWDTFRAVFPFFTLMYPDLDSHIMAGLVNTYKESGWLPEWASPGHRECMIGSNSASLIVDAYLKGINGYDIDTLFDAILKNTEHVHPKINSVGRYGCDYYNKLGYIPYDVGIKENTARTLEYAYDDFCVWKLAKALNRPIEEIKLYKKRARNYKNVFDQETGWMRGRNQDGSFQEPFNPFKWGDAFTEGNSLHYTWSVFQDIEGLINLMGGNQKFVSRLDTIFSLPPVFDNSYYGFTIHEIREMQIMDMGNYAHGNQPIQHMLYLYTYAGQPWKTQQRVREVMKKLYAPIPDGYCGDEDNGQTSAWFVFSSLGFYPVCPGSNQYVIGSPLFDKATIEFENGKKLVISAINNNSQNVYVNSLSMNGEMINRNYFTHEELINGGKIDFEMSGVPNKNRGISKASRPYSMTNEQGE